MRCGSSGGLGGTGETSFCESRRVARSGRNVGQPDQVIGDPIAGHEVERRAGAGEERLASTQHDGAEVESILIDQAELGQALRQDRSGDLNLAGELGLQPADHLFDVIRDERGVGAQ